MRSTSSPGRTDPPALRSCRGGQTERCIHFVPYYTRKHPADERISQRHTNATQGRCPSRLGRRFYPRTWLFPHRALSTCFPGRRGEGRSSATTQKTPGGWGSLTRGFGDVFTLCLQL